MKTTSNDLLFSLTYDSFRWDFSRGTGKGGQKRNKTSTKARCYHEESGAEGVDDTTRSQNQNKQKAFEKCFNSDKFQKWLRIEIARRLGKLKDVEAEVDKSMLQVKVEIKDEDGKWSDERDSGSTG